MHQAPPSLPLAWHHALRQSLFQYFWLKAWVTPLLMALFLVAYLYLLKYPASPPTEIPFTALDRWISFQPSAMPIYLSLWVYVSLPSALLGTQRDLLHFGAAMTGTCLIGLLIFYVWPSAVPPASINWALYPGMDTLKTVDAGGNACPSLHVATAVISAFWLQFILASCGAPRWAHHLNWVWCAGIIYSTVALRQHVVLDVLGGLLLGGSLAYLSLRQRRPYV